MRAGKPSDTAEAMAAGRALGGFVYRDEGILDDRFARQFLGRRYSALYRLVRVLGAARLDRSIASLQDRMLPGSVGWVLTRHRYFDDAIDEAIRDGAKQVVFVGAGYDSRALRREALAGVRVFEVDHPDTQARKKRILRRVLGELPSNVRFLALDATRGDLRRLPDEGFDRTTKAVIVLEGFLWYMPPEVARSILAAIVAIAAPSSQVLFDYILPSVVDGSCTLEGARQHRAYCERRGEPILFGIEPGELATWLGTLGLRLVDDTGRDELEARYTSGAKPPIKIYPFFRIARAAVVEAG